MSLQPYAHAPATDVIDLTRRLGTLPDDWVLTSVPALRGRIGPLDHVLLGPPGVFTLTVVRLPGATAASPSRGGERRRGSLERQVLRDTRAVQTLMSRALGRIVVTRGVIVVAEGPLRHQAPVDVSVIAGHDVPDWFGAHAGRSLGPDDIALLARAARS